MTNRVRAALLVLVATAFTIACAAAHARGVAGARTRGTLQAVQERASIVRFARRYLGIRYTYGGSSPGSGFDCSGFTRFVFAHFGISLPHNSTAQFGQGFRVARPALRPGDLVFFNGLGHVGLYVGGGRFIHAPHTGSRGAIDSLSGWYASTYDGARRVVLAPARARLR